MQYGIIYLKLDMGSNSFETVAWHEVKYCWSGNKTLIQFQHWSTDNYTLYMYQVFANDISIISWKLDVYPIISRW